MVHAGNVHYRSERDLPLIVPIFPLEGALLLPSGQLPLNIFEPRYLQMVDDAMGSARMIGMIQPAFDASRTDVERPNLCKVGCLGRITSFAETGDGRYILNLHGVARFRVVEELSGSEAHRSCRVSPLVADLRQDAENVGAADRKELLALFRRYLERSGLEADWEGIEKAQDTMVVNALSMMLPSSPSEKQALLEAETLADRVRILSAVLEMSLAPSPVGGSTLQ